MHSLGCFTAFSLPFLPPYFPSGFEIFSDALTGIGTAVVGILNLALSFLCSFLFQVSVPLATVLSDCAHATKVFRAHSVDDFQRNSLLHTSDPISMCKYRYLHPLQHPSARSLLCLRASASPYSLPCVQCATPMSTSPKSNPLPGICMPSSTTTLFYDRVCSRLGVQEFGRI